MKCRTARQKIRLLVGNDLSQNEVDPVQEHIAECVPCRQHVEEMLDSSDILITYSAEGLSQRRTSVWKSVVEQLPPQSDAREAPTGRQARQSISSTFRPVNTSVTIRMRAGNRWKSLTIPHGFTVVVQFGTSSASEWFAEISAIPRSVWGSLPKRHTVLRFEVSLLACEDG
jgi:hypothetical protein